MYWTHNEETSVAVERFIRTLKNKIYKYMTSISKSVFIDKLEESFMKKNCKNQIKKSLKLKR